MLKSKVIFYQDSKLFNEAAELLQSGESLHGWLYPKGACLKGQAPATYTLTQLKQAVSDYSQNGVTHLYFNIAKDISGAVLEL